MWNYPNCHRPQPFRHLILGPGLIRKEWRCGYCNALLRSCAIARAVMGLLAGASTGLLLVWMASDVVEFQPCVLVSLVPIALFVLCSTQVVLTKIDHTVCAHCRYDLHGNTSRVCPECGEPIQSNPATDGQLTP